MPGKSCTRPDATRTRHIRGRLLRQWPAVIWMAPLWACSGSDSTGPSADSDATRYIVTASATNVAAGAAVTISAQLANAAGSPVPTSGRVVTWSSTGSGGLLEQSTSATDASGSASVLFLPSPIAGTSHVVTARDGSGLSGTSDPVTVVAGPPAFVIIDGQAQYTSPGSAVPVPPTIWVIDEFGNGVPGLTIEFTITGGGGSATGTTASTDVDGVASVGSWTLGAEFRENEMTAMVSGFPGFITFTATAAPPIASCGLENPLILDLRQRGDLRASLCTSIDPTDLHTSEKAFPGAEAGGTYFYDLYVVDIPAGAIVRFEVAEDDDGTLSACQFLLAYTESGAYVNGEACDPVTINNSSGVVIRYQIVVTTSRAGEEGAYSIIAAKIL